MSRLLLHYMSHGSPVTAEVTKDVFVIGRDPGCDLAVADITVSRRHTRISRDPLGFVVEDMGSKNGTMVNGQPAARTVLRHGDELMVGHVPLRVEIEEGRPMTTPESSHGRIVMDDSNFKAEGTIVRSVKEMEKFLTGEKTAEVTGNLLEAENRVLKVLSQVARALISVEPLQDTLNKVMDLVLKHIKAARAILLLKDEKTGELVPYVVRMKDGNAAAEIHMSRTMARMIIEDKVAILSSDIQTDARFKDGDSIRVMGIQSAMCAPLWNNENVIGLIQVDSPLKETVYTDRDLDLLTALSNYAAVAIERSRLNERVEHEKALKSRLERYHSPQVAQRIFAAQADGDGGVMQAVEKNVTILYADLVGFTPMSARLTPREISVLLNGIFEHFTDAIFKHQGTLDKYMGDCVMAVFGAPLDQDDHALRGVRTAFDMLDIIDVLNSARPKDDQLAFHIGLNSGPVIAGDIGSPKRMEYSVLGDTVNLAARIQGLAPPNHIWVGPATYEAVKESVEAEHAGDKTFKGVEKPVSIYRLTRLMPKEEQTHDAN